MQKKRRLKIPAKREDYKNLRPDLRGQYQSQGFVIFSPLFLTKNSPLLILATQE
jgi:hypothetical protein